jgi:hypothetical protein
VFAAWHAVGRQAVNGHAYPQQQYPGMYDPASAGNGMYQNGDYSGQHQQPYMWVMISCR